MHENKTADQGVTAVEKLINVAKLFDKTKGSESQASQLKSFLGNKQSSTPNMCIRWYTKADISALDAEAECKALLFK